MRKNAFFIGFLILGLMVYVKPLWQLALLSFDEELYSHFFLIPVVSLYFFFTERKKIFAEVAYLPYIGMGVVTFGIVCYVTAVQYVETINQNDFLFLCLLGFVAWIIGGFLTFYGKKAFRKALFPLLFLVFMIPIPTILLDPLIRFLQAWSAEAFHLVLNAIGVPYFRNGMIFELSGFAVEVAEQCSGIRSSLALFITSVIAGQMFLETKWRKIALVLSIFPITIFKNALRITTLSLLAAYVDPSWITDSWLHKMGGIPFFIVSLCFLLAPFLWFLRYSELHREQVEYR